MRQQKRLRIVPLIILVLLAISAGGCLRTYTHDKVEMVTEIFHAIPDLDNHDLNSIRCEVIETDKHGRRLFAFTNGDLRGYCILQRTDDSYAYYYDNVSFRLEDKRLSVLIDDYDPDDLKELKGKNDWDKELDESKMVKKIFVKATELVRSREPIFDQKTVNKLVSKSLEGKDTTSFYSSFCDYSQTGQELFYIKKYANGNEYLLILNSDGTYDPENGLVKIDDWDNINSLLAEIKENNGWEG